VHIDVDVLGPLSVFDTGILPKLKKIVPGFVKEISDAL